MNFIPSLAFLYFCKLYGSHSVEIIVFWVATMCDLVRGHWHLKEYLQGCNVQGEVLIRLHMQHVQRWIVWIIIFLKPTYITEPIPHLMHINQDSIFYQNASIHLKGSTVSHNTEHLNLNKIPSFFTFHTHIKAHFSLYLGMLVN